MGVLILDRDPGFFETLAPTTSTGITAALINPVKIFGTAQDTAATTITLASAASATDGAYTGWVVEPYGAAAGSEQTRVITAYAGSTKVATVAAWGTTPTSTTKYKLIPPFDGMEAKEALVTVETYQVRFRIDGVAPAAGVGHLLAAGESYLVKGTKAVKNLRFIDTASGASSVLVTVFF